MDNNPSLRIHIEEDNAREERLQQLLHTCLPEAKSLADQFEATTGWLLNYRPGTPPADLSVEHQPTPVFGRFQIADLSAKWPPGKPAVSRIECERLLSNINHLVAKIEGLELRQHQARAQSQLTLLEATEESPLLPTNVSDKIANLLRFAKSELSGIGAAVYLLDENTTHLRLRSMIAPAQYAQEVESVRALENSLADLESLIGNKVNIHSPEMGETWRIPQPFRYGWCMMLGTKNLPLGTIWIFFSQPRSPEAKDFDFLDGLNNQLYGEIQSREKTHAVDEETALLQQELLLASRSNDARLPSFAPEVDGWKIAGWTYRQGYLASTFHDWAVTPAGNLSVSVGQVVGPMLTAAMSLNNLRSLISAHRDYRHSSFTLAAKLNEQIWCNSPGDELASLIYALVDPETNQIQLVNAGDGGVVFCGPFGVQSIDQFQAPLGMDLETQYDQWEAVLQESETLVLFTQGLRHAISESTPTVNDADLLRTILLSNPGQPHAILSEIEERFFSSDFQHVSGDLSVVVLSRSSTVPDLNQVAAEVSQSILAELRAEDCQILDALVKRIEGEDEWDYLSDFASSDSKASEYEQMWSGEPVNEYELISDGSEDEEGEVDEEIEQVADQPMDPPRDETQLISQPKSQGKKRQAKAKSTKSTSPRARSKAKVPSHPKRDAKATQAKAKSKSKTASRTRLTTKPPAGSKAKSPQAAPSRKVHVQPKSHAAKPTGKTSGKTSGKSSRKSPRKTTPSSSAAAAAKPAPGPTLGLTPKPTLGPKAVEPKAVKSPPQEKRIPQATNKPTNRAAKSPAKPPAKLTAKASKKRRPNKS